MNNFISIKTDSEIAIMREAGAALALIMKEAEALIVPGAYQSEIDKFIENKIIQAGMTPECKGYGNPAFPNTCCISVNDALVHGVPCDKQPLKQGDLLKVDVVARKNGFCVDMARSFLVGNQGSDQAKALIRVAKESFFAALKEVFPGNRVVDISRTIQNYVEGEGFFVVREFVGHGIGKNMHEDPRIPNYVSGQEKNSVVLKSGMTLAIEPMLFAKKDSVVIALDGWTAKSKRGYLSSHYEDTLLVTPTGCEVLTVCSEQ